jgi:MFS transporter, DHA1 family, multidrug resistance protein
MTVTFAGLIAYISSIQQIIFEVFDAPQLIGLIFASIAAPMALASYTNSRIVERFGLRRVGHAGALLLALVTASHAAIALTGHETLLVFVVLQGLTMGCFAFTSSNFGTLAMEHMAPIAGTASSVQGVVGTLGSAALGFAIGQAYDGTALPFLLGIAACSAAGFAIVAATEPNRLFAALGADPQEQEAARESTAIPEDLA